MTLTFRLASRRGHLRCCLRTSLVLRNALLFLIANFVAQRVDLLDQSRVDLCVALLFEAGVGQRRLQQLADKLAIERRQRQVVVQFSEANFRKLQQLLVLRERVAKDVENLEYQQRDDAQVILFYVAQS